MDCIVHGVAKSQTRLSNFHFWRREWQPTPVLLPEEFHGQRTCQVTQRLKYLPAMQETWVPSLGWEDPLEKEMTTHSSILAWRIPWTEEPGGLQSTVSQRVEHD